MREERVKHILLIFVFLCLCVSSAVAQQAILFLERGSVKLRTPDNVTQIIREDFAKVSLKSGTRIHTGKETSVKIKIRGKKEIIELSSSAFFSLGKITKKRSMVSLLTGKAKFKIRGKKSKKKKFLVRTVSATIGVKGTDFIIVTSAAKTNLLTLSGIVTMAPLSMPDVEIEVLVNEASSVERDTPPTEPVVVTPEVMKEIVNSDSSNAFENVEFGEEMNANEVRQDNKDKKEKEKEEQQKEEEQKEEENEEKVPAEKSEEDSEKSPEDGVEPEEEPKPEMEGEEDFEQNEMEEGEEFDPKEGDEPNFENEEGDFEDKPMYEDEPMFEEDAEFFGDEEEFFEEQEEFENKPTITMDGYENDGEQDYYENNEGEYDRPDEPDYYYEEEELEYDNGELYDKDEFEEQFDEQQDTSWDTDDDYGDFPEDEFPEEYDNYEEYENYDDVYEDIDDIENTIDDMYDGKTWREFKIKLNRL